MSTHDERIRTDSRTPAEIAAQRRRGWPDFHPEHYCHNCGQPNACWFTPSEFWNRAEPGMLIGRILCPVCFMHDYEERTSKRVVWRIEPDLENDREAYYPDLIACPNEHCGRTTTDDELTECAGSVAHLVIPHCPECHAECLHHGPCGDEAGREWAEEHGRRT